ncbi:ABC transporter permease [Acrocarpospora catenulata]|uniref:ABC transporter permease n=1 Tax=Acrocarpospora catenulata TaxID=2836182 RepID=UPI002023A9AA|nr:ABC transporter permease [Acrocarpospora catenulata]
MNATALAVLRRLAKLVLVLFLVSVAAFLLLELIPGDPLDTLLPEGATAETRAQLEELYGLNDPMVARYLHWLGGALQGDLGRSFQTQLPVTQAILERVPVTVELAALSTLLALVVAVPFGVYAGYRPGGVLDRVVTFLVSLTLSVPNFLMGILLIFVCAVTLGLFPVSGWVPWEEGAGEHLRSVALPVLTLASAEIVVFVRLLRNDMVATLQQDFALAARARGLPTAWVLFGHALRPSSFSLVTVLGVSLARLIGGTVIVENLFALPGVGTLVINAISSRDYLMVQGIVLLVATVYVVLNTAVDLSYPLLDPRVRKS